MKLRFDLFDAPLVRRLTQQTILTYFGSTQIGSSREMLDVWARPNSAYISILMSDQELVCSRGTCFRGAFSSSTPV